MEAPKGRRPKKVDGNLKNKMVTLRLSGDNYNALCDVAAAENVSLNALLTRAVVDLANGTAIGSTGKK